MYSAVTTMLARLQIRGRGRARAVVRQRGDHSSMDHLRLLQLPGLQGETRLAESRPEILEFDAEVSDERCAPEHAAQRFVDVHGRGPRCRFSLMTVPIVAGFATMRAP